MAEEVPEQVREQVPEDEVAEEEHKMWQRQASHSNARQYLFSTKSDYGTVEMHQPV